MNTSTQTERQSPKILKYIIAMIGGFAFLQVYSIQSILPILMHDLQATEVQAGLAVSMTVIAIALVSPFMGMLSDTIGRKNIIVSSLFFLAIPTALIGFSHSIFEVYIWRFLQGLSVPGITVVTIAYIGEECKNQVAKMMSFYVSGTVLGGFLGRFLEGHLQNWIGWQNGYLVMSVLTLFGATIVSFNLPKSKYFIANKNIQTSLNLLVSHLKNQHVLTACALGACVLFSLVGLFTFINLHLARSPYLFSSESLANIFALYLIGMVITPLSGFLIQRFGTKITLFIAVSCSLLGALITLFSPLWLIILGLTIMSSGVFVAQSTTISYIAQNVSEGRSLASGLYYAFYYTGGGLGGVMCGYAFVHADWQGVVLTLASLQILGLLIILKFIKNK